MDQAVPSYIPAAALPPDGVVSSNPFVRMAWRQRLFVLGVFLLYVLAVGYLTQSQVVVHGEQIVLALALHVLLLAFPIIFYRSAYGWFHPLVFNALVGLSTLIRRFPMYGWGLREHVALPSYGPPELNQLLVYQLVLMNLGLITYYAGFFLCPSLPTPRVGFRRPANIALKIILVVAVAVSAFLLYMRTEGGLSSHLASWALGRHAALEGEFYWILLIMCGAYGCLVWFAADRAATASPLFWACSAVSLALIFLALGSRGTLLNLAAIGLIVWMVRSQKIPYVRIAAVAAAGLLLIAVLGTFRRSTWHGAADWSTLQRMGNLEDISEGATEASDRLTTADGSLPILALVPNQVSLLRGSTYLAMVLAPVPKKLWPGKPPLVGGLAGQTFFHTTSGVPPGVLGEAYWNFHIAGVVAVFFLWGAFQKWMAKLLRKDGKHGPAILLYAVTLILCTPTGAAMVQYLMTLSMLLLLLLACGVIGRRREATA